MCKAGGVVWAAQATDGLTRSAGTTTTYHQLICGGDLSCESFGYDATVLADYALTTTWLSAKCSHRNCLHDKGQFMNTAIKYSLLCSWQVNYCEPGEPAGYPIRIPIPRIQQRSIPWTVGPGRSCRGKSSYRFPLYDWPWPGRTPHVTPARGPDWPARSSSNRLVSVLEQLNVG